MNIFHKNNRIRHKNCLDLDIVISSHPIFGDNEIYFSGIFWNRHYNSKILEENQYIKIKNEDISKWKLIK